MTKIFLNISAIITILFFANTSNSQNYNWIIPNKTYLKLFVADDGIYRINKTDFTNAGINTAGIDPRTVRVFNKGAQIPVYFEGAQDGSFDVNDFMDFYGTRNYGGPTNTYTDNNIVKYVTDEYYNLYSDTNAYWVDWGGAAGLRMQISNYSVPTPYISDYYYEPVHFEKDKYYFLGESIDGNDFRYFTNEKFLGEGWYWSLLNNFGNVNNLTVSDTVTLPLLSTVTQNAKIRIFAYPYNVSTTIFNEHTLQVKINGNIISSITVNDYKKIDTTLDFSSALLTNSGVNTVAATYVPAAGFETVGGMNFDLFELQYPRIFKFRNSLATIQLAGEDTTSRKVSLTGYVSVSPVNIYDVINGIKINAYTSSSDTLKFTGKGNAKIEVTNKAINKKPFRIIQRQVPDYVSNTNGADYLLVYNSMFQSQATQLKNHRVAYDNFRVTSADIQDIYDIFGYGLEGPAGLKNFVKYVYYNWQLPRVKYICLFGRGSEDPKKNSSSSVYYKNLIPVIGTPTSDNYFANVNSAGFTYYDQISIGRLSAYSVTEAQAMVDNIITYEAQNPQQWYKSFTYIVNGGDSLEQATYQPLSDSLISKYVTPPSVSGNPVRIYRNDYNGGLTYNYSDSIKNQINRGTMTVNYIGHAGSQDWEIGLTDPNTLSNYNGKFPFIMSMTCYTGKIAEPNFRVFGERFMTMNNKGAIGYVGTSGWGFLYSGTQLNDFMMKAIAKDTIRRIGDIFATAIRSISIDSVLSSVRHTINCYTLQGDPAVKIKFPKNPEYSVSPSDYKLSNSNPVTGDPVTLTVYPKNFGLYSDSCKIRFQLLRNAVNYLTKDTTLRNFKFSDSIKYNFTLDFNDTYTAIVTLDYPNYNPNEYKNDNILNFNISTVNVAYIPLKPVNNSIVRSDSVELTGLNPFVSTIQKSVKLLLNLDTTKNFNSSLKQSFVKTVVTGASTKFKAALPRLDTNVLYYWRTNSIVNGDSAGWSQSMIFRYNPQITFDKIQNITADTTATIYKNKQAQYSDGDFNNVSYTSGGIKLNDYTGNLYIRSYGSNGSEASYFSCLSRSIHIDAGANTGLNLIKVRKTDGTILQFRNFKMLFGNSSDSVLSFLSTFDTTQYLMGLNAAYVGGTFLLNTATINKFAQFGSTQVQNFRVGWFDTWSFIGYLNAPASDVSETLHRFTNGWVESLSSMDRTFKKTSGTVSYLIGPANNWKDFSWQSTLLNGSSIKFDVYGIDRSGVQNLLLSNLTTSNLVNLNSINAYQYPKLNLIGKLIIDTTTGVTGSQSPALNSFKLHYTPPAEVAPDLSSFWQSDTSIKVNQEMKIQFNYYNAGYVNLPGVIVNLYKNSISPQNIFKSDTIARVLKPDSMDIYTNKFNVPYFRFAGSSKSHFVAEIVPIGANNEFYTFNNSIDFYLKINSTSGVANSVSLYSDGQIIKSGDYVRKKPELKISFNNINEDKNLLSDTTKAILQLNNIYVPYYVNGAMNSLFRVSEKKNLDNSNGTEKLIYYYPTLNSGENKIRIISKNDLDNGIDSSEYDVIVTDQLVVTDFYNYPNPMKGETSFIINISGSEIPLVSKIRIYTVSGRLIKEINSPVNIGYNQIAWDGRDNDGDQIANGTYFYKFVAEDNSKKETAVQKLVVLR